MTHKEASDKIEAVLNEVLSSNEDHEEGDILFDWIVIGYAANPDKGTNAAYPMFFSNGDMPNYRARGLLTTGLLYIGDGTPED